jgi:hypothetical protein
MLEAFGAGGPISNLGGGCGAGGSIDTSGSAAIGNPKFRISLAGADPSATIGVLNLSPPGSPIVCGPCSVNPYVLTTVAGLAGGSAQVDIAVPCKPSLVGKTVEAQWSVALTSSSTCSLADNFSFSDRLLIGIDY